MALASDSVAGARQGWKTNKTFVIGPIISYISVYTYTLHLILILRGYKHALQFMEMICLKALYDIVITKYFWYHRMFFFFLMLCRKCPRAFSINKQDNSKLVLCITGQKLSFCSYARLGKST